MANGVYITYILLSKCISDLKMLVNVSLQNSGIDEVCTLHKILVWMKYIIATVHLHCIIVQRFFLLL